MIGNQSFELWKAIVSALYGLAVITTAVRFGHRFRVKRLWIDDYLAIIPAIFAIVAPALMWDLYKELDTHRQISKQTSMYWAMSVAWLTIMWFSRICLALSLGRLVPTQPASSSRRAAFSLAYGYSVFYVVLFIYLLTSGCKHRGRLHDDVRTVAYCNAYKEKLTIAHFVFQFLSDTALIVTSIVIFLKGKHCHRRSVLSVTGSGVMLLLATIVRCAFTYSPSVVGTDGLFVVDMTGQIEAITALFASNLPCLVGYLLWRSSDRGPLVLAGRLTVGSTHSNKSQPLSINVVTLTELDSDRDKYRYAKDGDDDADTRSDITHQENITLPALSKV